MGIKGGIRKVSQWAPHCRQIPTAAMYSSVGYWVAPSLGGLLSLLLVMALMLMYVVILFEVPCARMYIEFEFE